MWFCHIYCHGRLEGVKEIRKTCSVRKESRLESSQNREAKIKACHRKARKAGGNITVPSTINSITDTVKKKTNKSLLSKSLQKYKSVHRSGKDTHVCSVLYHSACFLIHVKKRRDLKDPSAYRNHSFQVICISIEHLESSQPREQKYDSYYSILQKSHFV